MPLGSLRGRVMAGAVLWTAGLFAMITVLLTFSATAMRSIAIIHSHGPLSAVIAVACMIAGFVLVRRALAPFDGIRARLADVRKGAARELHGSYPTEVQPLVDDLNALLVHRERVVARAVAKAGDLAHGLKTPLAVLAQEAERAGISGHHDIAETMAHQVDRMRRQIDYHLAHTRAAASGATPGAQCAVLASAEGLARTLQRLYDGRAIEIAVSVGADHCVRAQREDVDEMLGNLLDNACKWGSTCVFVASAIAGSQVVVTVDDDGPGLEPSMWEAVLQRGVRADQAAPGSGFGLAIVRDLAELYGGAVAIGRAPLGGLRAELRLPAC